MKNKMIAARWRNGVSLTAAALVLLMSAGWAEAKKTSVAMLIPDSLFISPNQDGVNDTIRFRVKTENIRGVQSWDVQFKDSALIVRKTLSGLKGIPGEIAWDGTDEFNARAPEGNYEVTLKIWDEKNQFVEASVQKIVLDMTPPTLSLTAQSNRATLNKDGNLSPVTLYFSAVDLSGLKEWKIQFLDDKRQAFHMESVAGALPASWVYDGTGFPVGTKKMLAILGVTDMAGNKAASPPIELTVDFEREVERKSPEKLKAAAPIPVPAAIPAPPREEETVSKPAATERGPMLQMTSIVFIADLFGDAADDQSPLLPQAETLLAPLAQALLDSPGSRATILGHVDSSVGSAAKTLSSTFAWKVFSFFAKDKGVDKNNLSVKGLGSDVAIADNRTPLGRTRNRRIEIQLFFPRNKS